MTTLMKKDKKFEWDDKCEESFQLLKQKLVTAPVLTLPDDSGVYDVYSDASKNGLGYHVSIGMSPFDALYGRKCRITICWNDISETMILRRQMIEDTVKQVREIQAKIQTAQDYQKSNADLKLREQEFKVGDKVLLKVSPMKRVMTFGKKGKLSPKYIPDKSHVLQPETIELDQSLIYEERPVKILDSKMRSTYNKNVKIVKVLWSN
ncbi:uncharacterized protein LOC110739427 [Chenopodium quinoa]|uniref:uncharacterized protein LOC110739427 n=1 Tax=Chenopodium quinoa TaxID=63459 RepID=UPI000B787359|nr:uncharacterized protein LOC110739427 [Chenopodium quinoa]